MTIEHLKIARLTEQLIAQGGELTDDEVTALAWAAKNADWLGLNDNTLADPRVVKMLNLVEDVYFNRVPDPTDGATQATADPKLGEVPKTKIGRFLFY